MKKNIVSLFMLMCAVVFSQNLMAQTPEVVFEEKFAGNLGDFKVEGFNGDNGDIWSGDYDCAKADAYRKIGESQELVNYLVSPQITLGDKNYEARFEHCCDYFTDYETQVGFVVREVGGEWTEIKITKFWSGMFTLADKMPVPAELKGKTVEFGFKYTSPGSLSSGIWKIKNFMVEEAVEKPAEKADPLIAFGVLELVYDLGSHEEFVSPELFNPLGLPVKYSSENEAVATVDENGKVTVIAEGVTTITATTEETEVYKAGKDSYVLNVTDDHKNDPVLKDPELSFSEKEVVYELSCGEPFEAPVFNNPYGVDVKFYSDFPDVASVDENTGEVTIKSVGTTAITVLSWDDAVYYGGFAKYIITVVDNTVLYVGKDFGDGKLNGFTEEGEAAGKFIWMPTVYGGWIQANGYKKVDKETATYMVSPEIKLDRNGNTLSFVHTGFQFENIDDMQKSATVYIRETGGEWKLFEIPYPFEEYEQVAVDRMEIPAEFNGKTIQVGFKYVCDGTVEGSGTWSVKDIYVRRTNLKPAADISFAAETVEFNMNDGTAFVAPELINPEALDVTYSSSDENVAAVDALTGDVTVMGEGTVTISATSAENDKFAATTASYTITVTATATGIDAVMGEGNDGKEIYDLQGRKINRAEKGIYIVNGKKVVIK